MTAELRDWWVKPMILGQRHVVDVLSCIRSVVDDIKREQAILRAEIAELRQRTRSAANDAGTPELQHNEMMKLKIPYPTVSSVEEVYVAQYRTASLGVQLCRFPEALLTEISDEIEGRPLKDVTTPPGWPEVGDVAVVTHSGRLVRSIVREVYDAKCLVELVDHGPLDVIDTSTMRPLDAELCEKWPQVAVQVVLKQDSKVQDGHVYTLEEIEQVEHRGVTHLLGRLSVPSSMLVGAQPVQAFACSKQEQPQPKMEHLEAAAVAAASEKSPVLQSVSSGQITADPSRNIVIPRPELSRRESVVVISVDDVSGKVGAQLTRFEASDLDELANELTALADTARPVGRIEEGDYVLALSAYGPTWSRALVTGIGSADNVHVEFVDYGSFESVKTQNIKELNESVTKHPAFAILLKLGTNNVKVDEEYDVQVEAMDPEDKLERTWIASIVASDGNLLSCTTDADKSATPVVVKPAQGQDVTLPDDVRGIEDGVVYAVDYNDSKLEFGIQLTRGDVTRMESHLANVTPKQAKSCVAVFEYAVARVQDVFCRALVVEVSGDNATVLCVDYGSFESVPLTEIFPLEQGYATETPTMALRCVFKETLTINAGERCRLRIYSKAQVKGVTTFSVSKLMYPPLDLDRDEVLYVTEVDAQDSRVIAVQLSKYNANDLFDLNTRLTNKMLMETRGLSIEDVYCGSLVAVPLDEDEFYRGVVSDLKGNMARVLQVDFGVVSEVPISKLAHLPDEFVDHPQVGFRCRLGPNQTAPAVDEEFKATNLQKVCSDAAIEEYTFTIADDDDNNAVAAADAAGQTQPTDGNKTAANQANKIEEFGSVETQKTPSVVDISQLLQAPSTGKSGDVNACLSSSTLNGFDGPSLSTAVSQDLPTEPPALSNDSTEDDVPARSLPPTAAVTGSNGEMTQQSSDKLANGLQAAPHSDHVGSFESVTKQPQTTQVRSDDSRNDDDDDDDELANIVVNLPCLSADPQQMYVTCLSDDGQHIGLQFCHVDESVLNDLVASMTDFYKQTSTSDLTQVEVGDMVAFCDEGQFYRAEVIAVNDDESCVVIAVDYATTHTVPRRLPRLVRRFARHERFAVRVEKTFDAQVDNFVTVVVEKTANGDVRARLPSEASAGDLQPAETKSSQPDVSQGSDVSRSQEEKIASAAAATAATAASLSEEVVSSSRTSIADTTGGMSKEHVSNQLREQSKTQSLLEVTAEECRTAVAGASATTRDDLKSSSRTSIKSAASSDRTSSVDRKNPKRGSAKQGAGEAEFDVLATWIFSPTKLCVVRESLRTASQTVVDELARLSAEPDTLRPLTEEEISTLNVSVGFPAVVRLDHPHPMFHRAKLLALDAVTNLYRMYLADSGEIAQVAVDALFQLPPTLGFDQMPALAMIITLRADDNDIRVAHSQPREILPMFDGVLRCRVLYSSADEEIPGELCHMATLSNARGDVVQQLFEEGIATLWSPRFVKNSLLMPQNDRYLTFADARLVQARVTDDDELRVTLQLRALHERAQRALASLDDSKLKPLVTLQVGSPALIKTRVPSWPDAAAATNATGNQGCTAEATWARGKIIARDTPVHYTIRLIDYGEVVSHPVKETFCCPMEALSIPEAVADVPLCVNHLSQVSTSDAADGGQACDETAASPLLIDRLKRLLLEMRGKTVIVKPRRNLHAGLAPVSVDLFDDEGVDVVTYIDDMDMNTAA